MSAYRDALAALAEETMASRHVLLEPEQPLPDLLKRPGPGGLVGWGTSDRDIAELLALQAQADDAVVEVRTLVLADGYLVVARVREEPPVPSPTPVVRPPRVSTGSSAANAIPSLAPRSSGPKFGGRSPQPVESPKQPSLPSAVSADFAPDARPIPGATLDALDPLLLARIGPDPVAVLLELGAAHRRGRVIVPSLGAVVLLGRHPATWVLGAALIATADGEPMRLLGPLPDVLRSLDGWPPIARSSEIARLLVLEAHLARDWSENAEAAPIALEVTEHDLEVRFPRSSPPNSVIRALAARLGLPAEPATELTGRGVRVQRIVRAEVSVLRARWPANSSKRPYLALAERQEVMLAHLRDHGDRSTRELIGALGWSRATVRVVLATLLDDGRVQGTSNGRQAPGQRYRLVESAGD